MANDLSWAKHVIETVHKANNVLGLLKCTVGSKNKDIFLILYKSLIRLILEYASMVWSPLLKTSMKLRRYKGELHELP